MGKLTAVLTALVLLLAAAPARGDVVDTILRDCGRSSTGLLVGSYGNADLRKAARALRGDLSEYSGCYDAIQQQLRENRERGGGGGGTGGDGGAGSGGGAGAGGSGGAGAGGAGSDGGFAAAGGAGSGGAGAGT
ncbi:hypothetical protein Q7L73_27095, partial [Conexibacter sp. CPCC 205762]